MPHSELQDMLDLPDQLEVLANESVSSRSSERIAHIIRKAILSGSLPPGEHIRERSLAEELQISRTPVREALFILQGEGLVDLSHKRGARVAHITSSDIRQIYSLRRVLEAHAARSAAEHHDRVKLAMVAEALDAQQQLPPDASPLEQAQADLAFHEAIAAASGSKLLYTVAHQVLAVTVTHRSRYAYSAADAQRVWRQHRAILNALESGNADMAESLMLKHVDQSTRLALKHLDGPERADDRQGTSRSPKRAAKS